MSALQSKKVKTISTTDDDVELSAEEHSLLDQAAGKVLLFRVGRSDDLRCREGHLKGTQRHRKLSGRCV